MKSIMLLATIGVLTLAHPAKTLAADTTKFVIDPAHSYVNAYAF